MSAPTPNKLIRAFSQWHGNPPAQRHQVSGLQATSKLFGRALELADFYLSSNGGEGRCGTTPIALWPIERIVQLNEDYKIRQYLGDGYLAIGSDGGPDCLALRRTDDADAVQLVFVPFGDLEVESVRVVGDGFGVGIQNCASGAYKHPE